MSASWTSPQYGLPRRSYQRFGLPPRSTASPLVFFLLLITCSTRSISKALFRSLLISSTYNLCARLSFISRPGSAFRSTLNSSYRPMSSRVPSALACASAVSLMTSYCLRTCTSRGASRARCCSALKRQAISSTSFFASSLEQPRGSLSGSFTKSPCRRASASVSNLNGPSWSTATRRCPGFFGFLTSSLHSNVERLFFNCGFFI